MNVKRDAIALGEGMDIPGKTDVAAVFAFIEALDLNLQNVAKDISESRQFLSTSFGQIAANFAKVHSIARAGEESDAHMPNDTLIALRRVVDGLTVELQFEDSLSQSLGYAVKRIESISVALNQTRAIVCERSGDGQGEHALTVLARTLDSLRKAERPGGGRLGEGNSGSVDLF
ncbi:protein of unknown function [Georgfuchsia toluolica]|uniref:Uncharacterized protein n=1 Tax=Georgfuchsia toluolica TaxID=424218 RepID=A0A916J3B3_9PROT|nr:hypothetical protein [Georgfuchsia toluolica]CAG4882624.1 protein of unknown function [Georgfuchsia toluolica]